MRKKITLLGLCLTIFILTATATPINQLFHDTETGQIDLNAGTVDTKIGWTEILNENTIETVEPEDNPSKIFNLTDLRPQDNGSSLITLKTESNPHWLKFYMNQTGSYGKAFYQLDFAEGDVIHNLSSDSLYGSRMVEAVHDNNFNPDRTVDIGSDCVEDGTIKLINSENRARVNFTLKASCSPKEYTFASYNKLSSGGWKPDEAQNQTLSDYKTKEYEAGTYSVEINLPQRPHSSKKVALEENLKFNIWVDDGNGELDGYENLVFNGSAEEINTELSDGIFLNAGSSTDLEAFTPGDSYLNIQWQIDDSCEVAGESKTFDIGFKSMQERNNPGKLLSYFHDSEYSRENKFSVSRNISCGNCENFGIESHEDGESIEMQKSSDDEEMEELNYVTEIKDGSIKFEHENGEALGEDGKVESQNFTVKASDPGELSFRIKAGPEDPVEHSLTLGETVSVMDGAFQVELTQVDENPDGTESYTVKVTSDDEGGNQESYALSFIEFNFCGEMPEFRNGKDKDKEDGNGKKGDKKEQRSDEDKETKSNTTKTEGRSESL